MYYTLSNKRVANFNSSQLGRDFFTTDVNAVDEICGFETGIPFHMNLDILWDED